MITTSLEFSLLVLSVEFALIAATITFFAYRNVRSSEAKTTSEATELVSKVAQTEDSRRLALETVFRDKYNYEAEELEHAVDEFMQREKAFYNAVVGAVLGRGDSKISNINNELTKVVAPWISITPKNMVDAESAELLKADKGRLELELGETKETLEKMISEYNRAFHLDATDEDSETGDDAGKDIAANLDDGDDEHEIEYQTEELHDLDDILESITEQRKPADTTIVKLDEEDDEPTMLASEPMPEDEPARAESSVATLEELEPLDDDEDDAGPAAETRTDKQMTADDLDVLMESLEIDEPADAA